MEQGVWQDQGVWKTIMRHGGQWSWLEIRITSHGELEGDTWMDGWMQGYECETMVNGMVEQSVGPVKERKSKERMHRMSWMHRHQCMHQA